MYQYYIALKDSKDSIKFEEREGYQLPNNFAACQENSRWTISDVLSGTKIVEGAIILKDAKAMLEKLSDQVEAIRKSARYKELTKAMTSYVESIPVDKRVNGWKRYFRNK